MRGLSPDPPRSVLEAIDLRPGDPVRPEQIADRDAVFVEPQLVREIPAEIRSTTAWPTASQG